MQPRRFASTQSYRSLPRTSVYRKLLAHQFDRLWQAVIRFTETTQEPKIRLRRGRQGQLYFEVYDCFTEKKYRFDSEQDARIWLDRDRFRQTETQRRLSEEVLRISNKYKRH